MKVLIGEPIPGTETEETPETEEGAPIEGGADILALFGEEATAHYVPVQVTTKGRPLVFHIKRLSPKDEASLDAKIERRNGRAITIQQADLANVNAAAITIAETVHRNAGTDEAPVYERLFSIEQLLGRPEIKQSNKIKQTKIVGLFDHADPEAKGFADQLAAVAYQVNPSVMPAVKKMAEKALQVQFGLADSEE